MGSHRFPLPWSPRSDSLDRCTSHEDRWSDFLRQRAKGGKRGFVLSVGALACQASRRRASFEQRSLGQVPRATPDAKVDPQSASA